ncbi:MAG: hypothetical protein KDM91_17445 [Verrucomicrobiae bacterium]|nr:hypothetical protein [Verrucomicrobiae bacterium]MCP5541164.1 hypothetical protein [Akkermansiaceae bacterium]
MSPTEIAPESPTASPAGGSHRQKNPGLVVYLCGLGTVGLTLFLVGLLNDTDFNIMGWYWFFVVPIGAMIVGAVAGLGYALGSRLMDVKIRGGFLLVVFLTAGLNWVASHYVTYRHLSEQLEETSRESFTFGAYMRAVSENFAFKDRSGKVGKPLGKVGYLFTILEMGGFSIGTLIPVLLLGLRPYCHQCGRYLKKTATRIVGSEMDLRDLKKLKKAEKIERIESSAREVIEKGRALFEEMTATPGYPEVLERLTALPEEANKKALAAVHFHLWKCPDCEGHVVKSTLTNVTLNGQPNQAELAVLDRTNAPEPVVSES